MTDRGDQEKQGRTDERLFPRIGQDFLTDIRSAGLSLNRFTAAVRRSG
jgi:hypothetical protein